MSRRDVRHHPHYDPGVEQEWVRRHNERISAERAHEVVRRELEG